MFTPEQDEFLAKYRYAEVEASPLFDEVPTHPEYLQRRRELKANGIEVANLRNRTSKPPAILTHPAFREDQDGKELWDAVTAFQQIHRKQQEDQIRTEIELDFQTDDPIAIVFMSDWHIGGLGTDHEALMRDIEVINDTPNMWVYVGGDPTDNFITDKLASAGRESQATAPGIQWKMYRYAIQKVLPKLLAVGRGNHDAWTSKVSGIEGIDAALQGIPVLHTAEDTYIFANVGISSTPSTGSTVPSGTRGSTGVPGPRNPMTLVSTSLILVSPSTITRRR